MKIGMAYFEFGGTKGTARAVAELSTRMAARGHVIDFHCVASHGMHTNIHFRHVPALNSFNSVGIASFALMAKRSLRRDRYDLTHSHGNVIGTDIITAHSCHKAGMRAHRQRSFGIANALRLYLEKKNYGEKNFRKVIAVAEGVRRELMEEYRLDYNDVEVIPNGVDLQRFHPERHEKIQKEMRQQLRISCDDCLFIFVANEFGRKGLDLAIAALSMVRDSHLLVLGDDAQGYYQEQAARMRVRERVHFLGAVDRVEDYYAAADAFLLPTAYEAFSLATLEAAASGLPLVVTKVNGTDELVNSGMNGYFVERDPDDIAARLQTLVSDRSLRERMGRNARTSVERYSWERIVDSTLDLYKRVQ